MTAPSVSGIYRIVSPGGRAEKDEMARRASATTRGTSRPAQPGTTSRRPGLDEIRLKYRPNTPTLRIADTPSNREQLGGSGAIGGPLQGRSLFEVPVQVAPVPNSVLEFAAEKAIVIRDPAGTVYRIGMEGPTP